MGCSSSAHTTYCDQQPTHIPYLHRSAHSFDRVYFLNDNLSFPLNCIQVDEPTSGQKSYLPRIFQTAICDWDIYSSSQISLQKLVEEIPKLTRVRRRNGIRFLTLDSDLWQPLRIDGNNNSNREQQHRLVGRRWSEPVHVYSSRSKPLLFSKLLKMDDGSKRPSVTSVKGEKVPIGPMKIGKPQIKMLLVFAKEDSQCQAVRSAATQMNYKWDLAQSSEKAVDLYLEKQHHLVVIDRRQIKAIDGDALCRRLRSTVNSESTTIVAIARRRNQIDDYPCTRELLTTGFNRVITETNRIEEIHNEFLQLDCGELLSRYKLRTYQAVFTVLEKSSDAIQITDEDHLIEYVNHAYEVLTGYSADEVIGHELSEFIVNDTNEEDTWDRIRAYICEGKEWEGNFYTKRSAGRDDIQQHVTICPITEHNRAVGHYVLVMQAAPPPDLSVFRRRNSVPAEQQLRRLSACSSLEGGDTSSHRRTNSLAKIHSMTIEAPITQIINLISIVKENSKHQVSETLDQILDILRNSELYSPADLPSKSSDHMVSDFVEGLVTGTGYTHRRPSGSDTMLGKLSGSGGCNTLPKQSSTQSQHAVTPSKSVVPPEVAECFENDCSWKYDILRLERITLNKPLVYLGARIMVEFGACEVLQCSEDTLKTWLAGIESKYHAENSYHNSTHAADVLHATAYFLRKERVKEWMEPLDEIAALVAAIIHDVDHPGHTNAFLINSRNPLALLYNDNAVLESHHAAYAFRYTVSDDSQNIFKGLSRDDFMTLRQSVIDMVLATELSKHFEHVNKFISIVTKSSNGGPNPSELSPGRHDSSMSDSMPRCGTGGTSGQNSLLHHEMRVLIKRVMIKMADVNNPARPRALCVEWARRISEEYFNQTDKEKSMGLPVVMPHFDRVTCQFPKSQITFIDYFLTDMFEAWHEFCNISEMMDQLNDNYNFWRMLLDNGLMSLSELEDVETGQMKPKENLRESPELEIPPDAVSNPDSATKSDKSTGCTQGAARGRSNTNTNNNAGADVVPTPTEALNVSIRVELPQSGSTASDGEAHQVVCGGSSNRKSPIHAPTENHLDVLDPDRISLVVVPPTSKAHARLHQAMTTRKHLTFKDPES